MKRLTAIILALAITLSLFVLPVAQADTYATATVKGGWLRLRAAASYDAETISAYYTGTRVTILGGSGSWYYVKAPDGNLGYMSADFLNVTGSITGGQVAENTPAYVTSKNGKSVNLRSGASTRYNAIASFKVGTPLTILISGEDWCKVRINGYTGYMMAEFITTTRPSTSQEPETGYTGYVTSKNGLGVRLRSGASKLYSTLATYPVGTQLTILDHGPNWCKVRVNGVTGYMMTDFITTTAPSKLTSVSINDTTPWPGETLYASVKPSGMSVSYDWYNDDGDWLGSGDAYTVRERDANTRIRVRAKGTNGVTGTVFSDWATVQGNGYVSMSYRLTSVTISDMTPSVNQTLTATIAPAGATANITWFRDDGVYVGSGSTYTVAASDMGRRLYAWAEGTGATTGTATSQATSAVAGAVNVPTAAPVTQKRVEGLALNDLTPTVGQTLVATVAPADAMVTITWYRDDDLVLGYGNRYTVQASDVGHTLYAWAEGTGDTFGSINSRITEPVEANVSLIVPVS